MSMTFEEKSLWLRLAGLLIAYGAYFRLVGQTLWGDSATPDLEPQHAVLFLGTTVLLIVILVAGHLAILVFDRHAQQDERDRQIALKGSQIGALLLASGVFAALCAAVMTQGNAIVAHVLLGSWILAESAGIVARLVLYRRGS